MWHTEGMMWRTLGMIARAHEAREVMKHSGLYGEHNEGLLAETLREFLPSEWEVGSGEILDAEGNRSPQCDIIIYSSRLFPPAHRSKTGKVVVFAHAVGAIIEVKSILRSGLRTEGEGDAQALSNQLAQLQRFTKRAMEVGTEKADDVCIELDITGEPRVTVADFMDSQIQVLGFAYSSTVSAEVVRGALQPREGLAPVFVLDVPRSAEEIQGRWSSLGAAPTKDALRGFAEWLREPNGVIFDMHQQDGKDASTPASLTRSGPQTLRMLIKFLSDRIRRLSPLGHPHTVETAEVIYSTYNPWSST